MATEVLEEKRADASSRPPVVNDFSIHVATANGSGSQSSNSILMRAIFQMGIPVSGKNLFPSNIQGLPTWFTIRASKEGFIARRRDVGVLICMNPETAHEDVRTVAPGAAVIYEESLKLDTLRNDVHFYPVPFQKLVLELVHDGKLRRLAINMIYVGVAAWLLDVDMAEIEKAVAKQFKSKAAAVEINMKAIRGGFEWAEKNLAKKDPFRLERMNATAGKIIIEGNAASAIGCMMGGVQFLAWYPITPSSSLAEALIDYAGKHRIDPDTGESTFAVVQAEDELAAARHGARRRLGGRARHDDDLGPGHLADVGVHGPRLLRRGAGRHRRRPARRTLDGPADPDDAGRHHLDLLPRPRRRPSTSCCSPAPSRSATRWRSTPSTSPSVSRHRSSS